MCMAGALQILAQWILLIAWGVDQQSENDHATINNCWQHDQENACQMLRLGTHSLPPFNPYFPCAKQCCFTAAPSSTHHHRRPVKSYRSSCALCLTQTQTGRIEVNPLAQCCRWPPASARCAWSCYRAADGPAERRSPGGSDTYDR